MAHRVLIIDDDPEFVEATSTLLDAQGYKVVSAPNGKVGIAKAQEERPDIILLDLHMPGVSGREAVKTLSEDLPGTRVLMLTVSEDADDLLDTLHAGAAGYLLKNIDAEYFIDAIRRAAAGDAVVSPEMTGKLVAGLKRAAAVPAPEKDQLSAREREVLVALARGASNKELAREFDLAESTVKIHVQNILRKLKLNSRVQAAVYAVEHGISKNINKNN